MFWEDDPPKTIVAAALLASINPEVLLRFPFKESVFAPTDKTPVVNVRVPLIESALPSVNKLLELPTCFKVRFPIVFEPEVKRIVPRFPFPVRSIVKSVAEVVDILAVVLSKKADEVPTLLNNVKSLPFIFNIDPSTKVIPPPELFPTCKFPEPPFVDNKIVFAVVD